MEKYHKGNAILFAILALGAVLLLLAAFFFWGQKPADDNGAAVEGETVVFVSPDTGESISVVFDSTNDRASLTGAGYTNLILAHATSASGARYVNEEEDLELLNRGSDVMLSKGGGQPFFTGNIGGLSEADKLEAGIWVWQATTIGDEVTEASSTKPFTLRFNKDEDRVEGTTDCNNFSGPYFVGPDNALSFGPFMSTLMYCEGSQETEFAQAVASTTSFFFTGSGALVLEFDGGSVLLGQQE